MLITQIPAHQWLRSAGVSGSMYRNLDHGGPPAVQITSCLTEAHRFDGYSRYSTQVRFRSNFQERQEISNSPHTR
jgi:hypothetical protein